jgi:NAD(P)H dehydrogenase (quinone)
MILVCTARGRIGSCLIEDLCKNDRFHNIVAGVRDPDSCDGLWGERVEPRKVDYDDPAGLEEAFQGVDRVVYIPSFENTMRRAHQGLNVIQAAQKQGVSQLVFIGFADARWESILPFAKAYAVIEEGLHESNLNWTIVRTAMYTGNLLEQIPAWLKQGELLTCAGDGKIAYVSREDISASIIGILGASVADHARKIYKLTGPKALSYDEVCDIVNRIFSTNIQTLHLSREEFSDRLRKIWGVAYPEHEHVARVTPLFQEIFKQGLLSEVTNHVELLSGVQPEGVSHWLERNI